MTQIKGFVNSLNLTPFAAAMYGTTAFSWLSVGDGGIVGSDELDGADGSGAESVNGNPDGDSRNSSKINMHR